MAIVITGTPGVGKTTVARELANRLGLNYINLADLVVSKKLYLYYDDSLKSYVVDVIKCRQYLTKMLGCREILDTHVLDAVPREKARLVIVLRLNPLELKKRLQLRGYAGRKLSENVEAEVLGVVLSDALSIFGENCVCEVDASGKDVEEVVKILSDVIEAGNSSEKCKVGVVDWLKDYYWLLEKK